MWCVDAENLKFIKCNYKIKEQPRDSNCSPILSLESDVSLRGKITLKNKERVQGKGHWNKNTRNATPDNANLCNIYGT